MLLKNKFSLLLSLYNWLSRCSKKLIAFLKNIKVFFIILFLIGMLKLSIYIFIFTYILKTPFQSIDNTLIFLKLQKPLWELKENKIPRIYKKTYWHVSKLKILLVQYDMHNIMLMLFIKSFALSDLISSSYIMQYLTTQVLKNSQLTLLDSFLLNNDNNLTKNLIVLHKNNIQTTITKSIKLERRIEIRFGEIHSSLFAATDSAQIPNSILLQIVDMFNNNINFTTGLHFGDRFYIIYETFWKNNVQVRTGRLLAGEFINGNNIYQAIWFHEPGSKINGDYYSFDGKSLRKTFFSFPLPCRSISSGFAMRKHPIRGLWKKHNGIDFAAPSGTPIYASGDGIISFIGKKNGYGNIVVIKHAHNYTTFYGHMSRFAAGISKGTQIHQNDIIGYVGKTGLATKPHLHYEFRIDNIPKNPLIINNLKKSLTGKQLQHFQTIVADMTYRLALLHRDKDHLSFTKNNH